MRLDVSCHLNKIGALKLTKNQTIWLGNPSIIFQKTLKPKNVKMNR